MNVKGALKSRLRWDADLREYRVQHKQDVQPFLDAAKRRRDVEEHGGITNNPDSMQKVASIPFTVILEIKDKYGLDLLGANRETLKRIFRIIEDEYPYLKTTNKRISR